MPDRCRPDLVLLDLGPADGDGAEVLPAIAPPARAAGDRDLGARRHAGKIALLDQGADDYLGKRRSRWASSWRACAWRYATAAPRASGDTLAHGTWPVDRPRRASSATAPSAPHAD